MTRESANERNGRSNYSNACAAILRNMLTEAQFLYPFKRKKYENNDFVNI